MGTDTNRIFDEFIRGDSLPDKLKHLLASQKKTWPDLKKNYLSLESRQTREMSSGRSVLRIEFNPGRIGSTSAKTDPSSIRSRICFLCQDNLPPLQKGILYRGEYMALCNPYPIFESHFTIANLEHIPQNIEGALDAFTSLMVDLGPQYTIFYNGPQCGASAPDHLHFQACPSGVIPVESNQFLRGITAVRSGNSEVYAIEDAGRGMLLVQSSDAAGVKTTLLKLILSLKGKAAGQTEPLLNLIAWQAGDAYRAALFPRRKFRPDCYHLKGEEKVLVSPAAVEMGGLIVAPVKKDFESMDFARASAILKEVSLGRDSILQVLDDLEPI